MSEEITKVVMLKSPIEFGGNTYDSLTLTEPTLDQLDQSMRQETKLGMAKALIASISGVPIAVIGKLKQRDLNACSTFLEAFTEDSPPAGEAKSPT